MQNFVSRISLYDVVAMIVPGGIVLMGLGLCPLICNWANNLDVVMYSGQTGHAFWTTIGAIMLFVLSYIIGILIQVFSTWLQRLLRQWPTKRFVKEYMENDILLKTYRGELNQLLSEDVDAGKHPLYIYYKAYNIALFHNSSSALPIFEKQIAMLRNSCLPLMFVWIMAFHSQWCVALFGAVGILCVISIAILNRKRKAVSLAFEECEAVLQDRSKR